MRSSYTPKRWLVFSVLGILAIVCVLLVFRSRPASPTTSEARTSTVIPSRDGPEITKSSQRESFSSRTTPPDAATPAPDAGEQANLSSLNSPAWSHETPASAPVIPPGFEVSKPEVSASIDGKNHNPQFHGSFSERMTISNSGTAS